MPQSINRVCLSGNLTAPPEPIEPHGETIGARFRIAVNDRIRKGDDWVEYANFFDVVVFRQHGFVLDYLDKGSAVMVDGKLRHERWEKDGQNRSAVRIYADNVQATNRKGEGGGRPEDDVPPPDPAEAPSYGSGVPDDDIPF